MESQIPRQAGLSERMPVFWAFSDAKHSTSWRSVHGGTSLEVLFALLTLCISTFGFYFF
ncbi:MAG: hypothetical protein K2M20_09235 [Lachnospiraceae bacterium]|nr:hypothetical protein [Lachnospiraceae bacterium]